MEWINHYLKARYEDGGRGPRSYDCWGLVREARAEHCGMRLLASYGSLRNDNPKAFTQAYRNESHLMEKCEPEHGAIAAVMHGAICVHVALVLQPPPNKRHWVLEINPVRGARFMPLDKWLRDHNSVLFFRDVK